VRGEAGKILAVKVCQLEVKAHCAAKDRRVRDSERSFLQLKILAGI
jgi:hypothetical protein